MRFISFIGLMVMLILLILALILQTGCTPRQSLNLEPTRQIVMTEVAHKMGTLQQELALVDPTLTAIARVYSGSIAPIETNTAGQTLTGSSALTITVTAIPGSVLLSPTWTEQAIVLPSSTLSPTPTEAPTPTFTDVPPTSTPTLDPQKIIDQDDFSVAGRWFTKANDRFTIEYVSDSYRIYSHTNTPIWSVIGSGLEDVILETDVTIPDEPADAFLGLVCRLKDDQYYLLTISPDGSGEIGKMNGAEFISLAQEKFQPEIIQPGANRLRADCIGNQFALYLNGNLLLQAQDSDFASGAVGVVAGNRTTTGIDVRFDNFIVQKP